jgi:hypothetical protein
MKTCPAPVVDAAAAAAAAAEKNRIDHILRRLIDHLLEVALKVDKTI